ncbi:MAG: OsmC family protein [Anaerolineales bacterium]|nr:OsmC family protein [Anaerolineales bacterium]
MDAKVIWNGRMTFDASADSGFHVRLGAEPEVGGDNDGFRPMEMIAIGLAGCTAMDVISILSKKRQEVTAFEVVVHAGRAAEHPKVFNQALIEYQVSGRSLDEQALLRAIELSAVRYCPAQAMFNQLMPIELHYQIYEDLGEGQRTLVKSGVFTPAV